MTTAEISVIISVLTLVVLSAQLFFLYKDNKDNHQRIKRQSTIEYYRKFSLASNDLKKGIFSKFADTGGSIALENIDRNTARDISSFLDGIEQFCVGINTGIFDIKIVGMLAGEYFIKLYQDFEPYIKSRRLNHPSVYIEFEKMVSDLLKIEFQKKTRKLKLHPPKKL